MQYRATSLSLVHVPYIFVSKPKAYSLLFTGEFFCVKVDIQASIDRLWSSNDRLASLPLRAQRVCPTLHRLRTARQQYSLYKFRFSVNLFFIAGLSASCSGMLVDL
jgi:hypothetical protein